MSHLDIITDSQSSPLSVVEEIASSNDWSFERSGHDEITILTQGQWTRRLSACMFHHAWQARYLL